jgi:hypothetical protein
VVPYAGGCRTGVVAATVVRVADGGMLMPAPGAFHGSAPPEQRGSPWWRPW